MKGIILAAGKGTRLSPATMPISKILLPIYDRPMVYYPLSILMMAGIKDVLVITNQTDLPNFQRTLGDGSQYNIRIQYEIQYVQRGIADAFIIAESFIGDDDVALILGDNIIYSPEIGSILSEASKHEDGALVFGIEVSDPERFGIVSFNQDMTVESLEEKPKNPKSNYAVIGLYFYDHNAVEYAKRLEPSKRGELEITDLNKIYLSNGKLKVRLLDKDVKWIDAGTFDSLLESSEYVHDTEGSIGRKILCPEIVAYDMGFVTKKESLDWIGRNKDNEYFGSIKDYIEQ
jgi:glucose-1-phosphate thymidylyltransferase